MGLKIKLRNDSNIWNVLRYSHHGSEAVDVFHGEIDSAMEKQLIIHFLVVSARKNEDSGIAERDNLFGLKAAGEVHQPVAFARLGNESSPSRFGYPQDKIDRR